MSKLFGSRNFGSELFASTLFQGASTTATPEPPPGGIGPTTADGGVAGAGSGRANRPPEDYEVFDRDYEVEHVQYVDPFDQHQQEEEEETILTLIKAAMIRLFRH